MRPREKRLRWNQRRRQQEQSQASIATPASSNNSYKIARVLL
jgi:hypothetical protein